jgi:uncharacterized protein YuzE
MGRRHINFEYDRRVDAAYVGLSKAKVNASEQARPGVIFDFDASGKIVGIEILDFARRFLSPRSAKSAPKPRTKPLRKSA